MRSSVAAIYPELLCPRDSNSSIHFWGYDPLYATTLISPVFPSWSKSVVENSVRSHQEYETPERYGESVLIIGSGV